MISFPIEPDLEALLSERVEDTLVQMTIEEKLGYLGGEEDMYLHGIPRLGLPRLKMSDGPAGVRCWGPTTAYPAPISLSASFNLELAQRFGVQIGRDARARGTHIWLGPGVNLARIPQNGRNFEYFGEDPFLTGRFAAKVIHSVQSQGVSATVKHFVANDHEDDRNNDSSEIGERVLREQNLAPFEAAVKSGGAMCAMSGYNLVNGVHCTQHDELVNGVLKNEWGFSGIFMSDWVATYDALGAAKGGLDLEMPYAKYLNAEKLRPLLASGELSIDAVDDKVRRIVRTIYAFDWDKRPQEDPSIPKDDPESAEVALEIAREGIVLLKNEAGFLPLNKDAKRTLALTGPNCDPGPIGGGGSAYTQPFTHLSPKSAFQTLVGSGVDIRVVSTLEDFADAIPLPAWKGEYFDNAELAGDPVLTRSDDNIAFEWGAGSPDPKLPGDNFSARWTTKIVASEDCRGMLLVEADDGIRVFVNGEEMLSDWWDHARQRKSTPIDLKQGKSYDLSVEYYERTGDALAHFAIVRDRSFLDATRNALADSDVVFAFIGFNSTSEGEGHDRSFALRQGQRALLDMVFSTSKDVVLVVNSGAGVDLSPWAAKANAILQSWYLGQNGAQALAEIIFGEVNPSGKLPVSFPATLKGTYYDMALPPEDHKMVYSEGVFTGYRWLDSNNVEPLFPFGFGLSYTSFAFSDCEALADCIRVKVTNTGKWAGAEVVQAYVGQDNPSVPRPKRELKGFAKVFLQPGESQVVTIPLDSRSFAYWDVRTHDWAVDQDSFTVWVGSSSRDLPVSAKIQR